WPLNTGTWIGRRAIPDDLLDLDQRVGMTFGGECQPLRIDLAQLHELIAEGLSHAHRFATELDREAPDRLVVVAVLARHAGGRRDAVGHAVLTELRPALAPQVGRRLAAVDLRQ